MKNFEEEKEMLFSELQQIQPFKLILSGGKGEYRKIVFVKKAIKGEIVYQLEKYTDKQVFHENIKVELLTEAVMKYFPEYFKQLNAFSTAVSYDVKAGKKGNLAISRKEVQGKLITILGNNRKKRYILEEGMDIPVFKELGIFTSDGRVVHSMYDKFRQINRFVEMVDDVLKDYKKDNINIIDFGCGKSYLTFILYYYIVEIRKLKARIVGLDLKEQVIANCNDLAKRFGYRNLTFELGDINGYKAPFDVDMVVTLHACDVATDYALYNAVQWNASYIMSVPCCQHEVNRQIKSQRLSALTKYGIVKERTAALITDAIRGCVLEYCGYKTDLMEFIDIAHSPKNILIRAIKKNVSKDKRQSALKEAQELCHEFGIKQTFYESIVTEKEEKG